MYIKNYWKKIKNYLLIKFKYFKILNYNRQLILYGSHTDFDSPSSYL